MHAFRTYIFAKAYVYTLQRAFSAVADLWGIVFIVVLHALSIFTVYTCTYHIKYGYQ